MWRYLDENPALLFSGRVTKPCTVTTHQGRRAGATRTHQPSRSCIMFPSDNLLNCKNVLSRFNRKMCFSAALNSKRGLEGTLFNTDLQHTGKSLELKAGIRWFFGRFGSGKWLKWFIYSRWLVAEYVFVNLPTYNSSNCFSCKIYNMLKYSNI